MVNATPPTYVLAHNGAVLLRYTQTLCIRSLRVTLTIFCHIFRVKIPDPRDLRP